MSQAPFPTPGQRNTPGDRRQPSKGLVVFVALLALFILGACGTTSAAVGGQTTGTTPQATHAPTATPKPKAWVTIQHFTGNQNTQTPTFHVPAGAQVVWSATPNDQYGGAFSITAYSSDGTYLDLLANTTVSSAQHGTTTAHNTGDDYFDISALDCTYDIVVQVYQ